MPVSTRPRAGPADKLIGQRVKLRRQELGMTQAELGAALDPPRSLQQIHRYEAGTNRLASTLALQISRLLKLPVSELLGVNAPKPTAAELDDVLKIATEIQKLTPKQRRTLLKFVQALVS